MQRSSLQVIGHFSDRIKTKWNATDTFKPGGESDWVAKLMSLTSAKVEILFFVRPVHGNEELWKGGGNLSIHFCGTMTMLSSFFTLWFLSLSSVSTEQWQVCVMKVVPPITSTARPVTLEKSESKVKSTALLTSEYAQGEMLQNYKEWVEIVLMMSIWSNDAQMPRFLETVAPDNVLWRKMLKCSHSLMVKWHVESTHFPDMENHQHPKGWIPGHTKIGPVLEVATNYHEGKPGVEIGDWIFYLKADLNRGSESLTDSTSSWEIWQRKNESMRTRRTL